VIGHLGPRISALLDGQLSPAEEERAWSHVHSCHHCRDEVEREGWVKTRLSAMQYAGSQAPSHLKGSLMVSGLLAQWQDPSPEDLFGISESRGRWHLGLAGIGGGAVGAAVMGVLALGASPANAPGSVDGPVGPSYGSSLTNSVSWVTAVIDRSDPRAAQAGRHHPASASPSEVAPLVRALRRTLEQ
jgi:anti-sigma factor RsiW